MPDRIRISGVRLLPGSWRDARNGLLGFVQFTINGMIRVDGVTLRRTVDGRLALSFPAKDSGPGSAYFYLRPLDERARREIEHKVFVALDMEEPAA